MVVAAHSRGVTRRWTGLTAITSMAASSSRMLRAPMSAAMAEPPAPAMSSAAAIGAASRTTPTITAAPVSDSAPELAGELADLQRDRGAERQGDEHHRAWW